MFQISPLQTCVWARYTCFMSLNEGSLSMGKSNQLSLWHYTLLCPTSIQWTPVDSVGVHWSLHWSGLQWSLWSPVQSVQWTPVKKMYGVHWIKGPTTNLAGADSNGLHWSLWSPPESTGWTWSSVKTSRRYMQISQNGQTLVMGKY